MKITVKNLVLRVTFSRLLFDKVAKLPDKKILRIIIYALSILSICVFYYYYQNGLGVTYNDARSHLDIGRRVVEGLKTGLAQLGSVWLPLPHILMIPTIWIDFFWHSGLSGAIQSMVSFVAVSILIYQYLNKLKVSLFGRLLGIGVFVANINILFLQSTAMTELLLLATMTAGAYYFMLWTNDDNLIDLLKSGFWIMVSTAIRYDGWFLFFFTTLLLSILVYRKRGYSETEGKVLLFVTMGGLAIVMWFIWNLLIFGDPLYFAFGPFSAHAQQAQISEAGELFTKGNLYLSVKAYIYALLYNSYTFPAIVGLLGGLFLWMDKKIKWEVKLATVALISPFVFNVLALYLGHSVLFVVGVMGDTWFNVRYGVMLMPSIAIFIGYLVQKFKDAKWVVVGLLSMVLFFAFISNDAVTIDDALIGASGKNVAEVSGWLKENAAEQEGFVLISAASHDAIIFSSGLPMKRFIHEGTGKYWEAATDDPSRWARWIVLRTNDMSDWTFREIKGTEGFAKFDLVDSYPFADIYQLKDEYVESVNKKPVKWE